MLTVTPTVPRRSPVLSEPMPARLRLPDLLQIADRAADDVLAGRYDASLPPAGVPGDERWFTRIHGDDEVDLWLISWVPDHATELHDHGGSLGALTVLSGSLDEFHWDGNELRRRRFDTGDQATFPQHWVHDVVWASPPKPVDSTLSVHAYSPPLTAMSYYQVTEDKALLRQRTVLTGHPENQ
jgi:hypothetical protein